MTPGSRIIVVNDTAFTWKAHVRLHWFRGWVAPCAKLTVASPSGSEFTSILWAKEWLCGRDYDRYDHSSGPAGPRIPFTPRDVRACILGAIKAGWVYAGRNKELFRLDPPPDGPFFGPRQAPPEESPTRPSTPWRVPHEACLVCFKESSFSGWGFQELARHGFAAEPGFRGLDPGWQAISYGRDDGKLEHGLVCSDACFDKYSTLVRRDLPTVYDHLRRNIQTTYETV